jgi:hypothetical protein
VCKACEEDGDEGRVVGGYRTLPMEGKNVRAVLATKTAKTTYPTVT